MSYRYALLTYLLIAFTVFPLVSISQKNSAAKVLDIKKDPLFYNDDILHCKLAGNLNALYKDRGDNSSYHPITLQYLTKDSATVALNVMAKTRGHFRRDKKNCKMPPILLDFQNTKNIKNTLFENQKKLKLVVPCQGDDYVIKEYLVYKLYNLLSDKSFRARLVQVDFEDSSTNHKMETHYCILIEDEKKMAQRNQSFVLKNKMLDMKSTDITEFEKMAVFQYMIGNTDWGVPYLQNIVLITKDSMIAPAAVPYDFDHAGIVDAPYAGPAPELEISSVRERLYRGFCEEDKKNFKETFDLFNKKKNDIYNVYNNCTLLNSKYIKFVTRYLDEFYKTINSNKSIEAEFGKPCNTDVRVEIKGLKK